MSKEAEKIANLEAEAKALRDQLAAKEVENKKLYKHINRAKGQITNLEIEIIDQQVTIESLQEVVAAQSATAEPAGETPTE